MDEQRRTGAAALSLEDRVALELGRMLLRFNALESISRFVFCQLLDDIPEREAEALLSSLPFQRLRQALLGIYRERAGDGPEVEELRKLLQKADQLEQRRNALVHSSYVYSALPARFDRVKIKVGGNGSINAQLESFEDAAAIANFVTEIDEVASA